MRPFVPLAVVVLLCGPAAADDLDLIPGNILDGPAEAVPAPTAPFALFVEETLTLSSYRSTTAAESSTLSHLARLGLRGAWRLGEVLALTVDGQVTHQGGSDHAMAWARDLRLDIKEAILGWSDGGRFVEAGRMTLKAGVASGFNPTDHFRAFSLITTTTEDSSQWREHRLGAVAARGQYLWDGGGISLAYAPDLADRADGSVWTDADVIGLHLDATNADHRVQLVLTQAVAPDLAPQLVLYAENDRPHAGITVSTTVGDDLVLYGEADLGRRQRLEDEAAGMAGGERWLAQMALGAALSLGTRLTMTQEYHYNGAGLDTGDAPSADVRALARDRQEPASRHSLWSHIAWSEAWGDPDLSLSALAIVEPRSPSGLVQVEAAYALSGATSAALRAALWLGDGGSVYGESSRDAALTMHLRHGF